jgi:hypothetical protein
MRNVPHVRNTRLMSIASTKKARGKPGKTVAGLKP